MLGYAKRPQNWGEAPFDVVHNEWFHVLRRGASNLTREASFYQALCGLLLMEAEFHGKEAVLTEQQVEYWERFQKMVAQGGNVANLYSEAGQNLELRGLLGATDMSIAIGVGLQPLLKVFSVITAAKADSKALMLTPLVVSSHSIEIIEAIKASTGDAGIARACDGVLRELEQGRADYVSRLTDLAINGELSGLLANALANSSVNLAVRTLLSGLGMNAMTSGAWGQVGGSCFAAFVIGMDIGFWLSGETTAYEHARMAHFAAYIQPGLGERWLELSSEMSRGDLSVASGFDAATRALILLNAYVNQETAYMTQCYANAVVPVSCWQFAATLPMEGYQRNYGRWNSGELFETGKLSSAAEGLNVSVQLAYARWDAVTSELWRELPEDGGTATKRWHSDLNHDGRPESILHSLSWGGGSGWGVWIEVADEQQVNVFEGSYGRETDAFFVDVSDEWPGAEILTTEINWDYTGAHRNAANMFFVHVWGRDAGGGSYAIRDTFATTGAYSMGLHRYLWEEFCEYWVPGHTSREQQPKRSLRNPQRN